MYSSALFLQPHKSMPSTPSSQIFKPKLCSPVKQEPQLTSILSNLQPESQDVTKMRSPQQVEKFREEKRNSNEKKNAFIEVTFLNKIARLYLEGISAFEDDSSPANLGVSFLTQGKSMQCRESSTLSGLIALAVKHFGIKLDFMTSCHFYNIQRKTALWSDSDLREGECYFMFFVRSGFYLSQAAFHESCEEQSSLTSLFRKPLFHRDGRDFRIQQTFNYEEGRVEEIFINESRKNLEGFHCPILQCAKNFQKSCDLTFHFNIETGNKPYACFQCNRQFRRTSALNRHLASCVSSEELRRSHHLQCIEVEQSTIPQTPADKIILDIGDTALFKPSLFQKELLTRYHAKLRAMKPQVREQNYARTVESAVVSVTCSQLLKNWSAHWEVNQLIKKGADERKVLAARINVCLQIFATSELLNKIKPKPRLPRTLRAVPWID